MLARSVLALVAAATLAACATGPRQQAAENTAVKQQVASEIKHICSLPEEKRNAQLKRLKDEQGVVLFCGKQ